ncbi:MAG TPA: hypothetical protein PK453_00180 [Leptospiraceae bacterium]|nr:hypothetical protein [Leptospiraceae bacterium]HMY65261.1 hypothetical protein [Leptospiraceae bacterium]HNF12054.1 hypothetical protein [Leptospiraceae bacterium]HNF25763.1 hypothetical protein [Leptospiraceae bacterium]HNI95949.1 hypothetical protein [Leptospiraceae bacterium]
MSKPGFGKLLDAMRKMTIDVNDREICKKLETLMLTSKDDLNVASVKNLLVNPSEFDPKDIPDPYTQYVKHFLYMVKRNEKLGAPMYTDDEDGGKKRKDKSNVIL